MSAQSIECVGCHKPRLIVLIRHGESESNKDKTINQHTPNHLIPLTKRGWDQARQAGVELLKVLNIDDKDLAHKLESKYESKENLGDKLELSGYQRYDKKKDRHVVFYTSPYKRTRETLKGILDVFDEYNELNCGVKICNDDRYEPCGKNKLATWTPPRFPSGVYENSNVKESDLLELKNSEKHFIQYRVKDDPRIREQDFGNFQHISSMQDVMRKRSTYGHFFYRFQEGESAADVYDRVASFQETLFRYFEKTNKRPRDAIVLVTHGIYSRVFLMKWFRWTYEEFESFVNVPNGCMIVMEYNSESDRYELRTQLPKWC
ncbi:hypothetical protein HG535_0A03510 [Zygotorulaspora mrakii]|uniref:Uncharacterized protein n=1 Tax=Zygotorulaspora mrakii TaxID=42260 RepID=A0A7H9AXW2_ZYGMR|nr:uncharacterized protein HG535_0A03510 [Zygotorulaspora mrakii]QLG70412.1 hypothetical protein HG535_0A03510 [Zygotorulaspora mrakii]